MRRAFRRLLPALIAAACAAAPGARAAKPAAALEVLSSLADATPQRLAAELKAARARVDDALGRRHEKALALKKATAARDQAAAAVARLKKQGTQGQALEEALRRALALDEEASVARSELMAAEAEVARGGAVVLRLYDALILEQRRVVATMAQGDGRRPSAVAIYQGLVESRDAVRRALLPVLAQPGVDASLLGPGVDVTARADDDIEALLEKADLARDLEERYLRRAEAVRRRILEVEEEQAVARDVTGMLRQGSLFDEEDRRLRALVPSEQVQAPRVAGIFVTGAATAPTSGGGQPPPEPVASPDGEAKPPAAGAPSSDNPGFAGPDDGVNINGVEEDVDRVGGDPVAQPPPSPPAGTAVVPTLQATEQAFLGAGRGSDAAIASLISSGNLSLDELKALEKKLKAEAKRMREQSKTLRQEVQGRARK